MYFTSISISQNTFAEFNLCYLFLFPIEFVVKYDFLLTFTNIRMKDDVPLVSDVNIIRTKALVDCKTSSVTSSPSRNQTGKINNCY